MKKLLSFVLALSMVIPTLTLLSIPVKAEEDNQSVNAFLTDLKDGRKALITMTFDDGDYETIKWVTSEFEKYNLFGSSMLWLTNSIGTKDNADATIIAKYQTEFAKGRLEPLSHSTSHSVLPSDYYLSKEDFAGYYVNNTQEKYQYQILDAKAYLEELFPDVDQIAMAPSNNTLSGHSYATDEQGKAIKSQVLEDGGALKVVQDNYYACRQGIRGYQSLDPSCDTADIGGTWYSLKIRGFKDEKTAANRVTTAKGWVDDVINNHQWLITMSHQIPKNDELSKDQADEFYAYVAKKVQSGDLWCTTFTEAVKYIRERQSSTVSAVTTGNKILVNLTMADKTEDGKDLPSDVFCLPLTVCVEVPADWNAVSYTSEKNGEKSAKVFQKDGKNYAYIDVVPDGTTVSLTNKSVRKTEAEITFAATLVKGGTTNFETLTVSKRTEASSVNGIAKTYVSFAGVRDTLSATLAFSVSTDDATVNVYGMMGNLSSSVTFDNVPGHLNGEGVSDGSSYYGQPLYKVRADGKSYSIDVTNYVLEKKTPVFAFTSEDGTAVISDVKLTVRYATFDFGHKVTIGDSVSTGLFDFTFPSTSALFVDQSGVLYKAKEEITLTKSIHATPLSLETLPGASLRLKGASALRFDVEIPEAVTAALALLPEENVTYGMIISTLEDSIALQKILTGKSPEAILQEDGVFVMTRNQDGSFYAAIDITSENKDIVYTPVSFILVRTEAKAGAVLYKPASSDFARSAVMVAEMALEDVNAEKDETYSFETADGKFSRYDESQIQILQNLLGQ